MMLFVLLCYATNVIKKKAPAYRVAHEQTNENKLHKVIDSVLTGDNKSLQWPRGRWLFNLVSVDKQFNKLRPKRRFQ